ncbi:unnamed protein product, partial [marine sediment metagenome]
GALSLRLIQVLRYKDMLEIIGIKTYICYLLKI